MKVLLIPSPGFYKDISGVTRYLEVLTRNMVSEVTYQYFSTPALMSEPSLVVDEPVVKRSPARRIVARLMPSSMKLMLGYMADAVRLARAIRPYRAQVDLIHVNRVGCETQTIAARLAGFRRIVATVHNLPGESEAARYWVRKGVERLSFACADRVIMVSESTYDAWHQRIGLGRKRVVCIANGSDALDAGAINREACRQEFRGADPATVFGICARLHPMKGHSVLIKAFAGLLATYPDCRLLIAGTGPEEVSLRDEAARLGLGDRVRFLGRVLEPLRFLAAVDVNVLPSVTLESMPYAVIEAALAGVPSIVSDVGGAKEVIGPSGGGIVVAARDVAALQQAMEAYAAHPEWCKRDGARVFAYALDHLTGRHMAQATYREYERLMAG